MTSTPAGAMFFILIVAMLAVGTQAQQAGTLQQENHPPLEIQTCTVQGGCKAEAAEVVIDANWYARGVVYITLSSFRHRVCVCVCV